MALESVLLVVKVIVRVKKGGYDIALISHVNEEEFNKMSLVDARRFSVEKETYPSTIYNCSHPFPDSIREDASLDGNDQGIPYGLDDVIMNDSDFEDTEKSESSYESEEEDEDEQDQP